VCSGSVHSAEEGESQCTLRGLKTLFAKKRGTVCVRRDGGAFVSAERAVAMKEDLGMARPFLAAEFPTRCRVCPTCKETESAALG